MVEKERGKREEEIRKIGWRCIAKTFLKHKYVKKGFTLKSAGSTKGQRLNLLVAVSRLNEYEIFHE